MDWWILGNSFLITYVATIGVFFFHISNWKEKELRHKNVIKLICFFKSNMVTKSKLVHVSPRTYKSPNSLNIVIRMTKVWCLWFFMQVCSSSHSAWTCCVLVSPQMSSLIFQVHLQSQHLVKGTCLPDIPCTFPEAPASLWVLWPCGWAQPGAGMAQPGADQGVAEVWYFTKAMAASSLQNSSSTITPSSNVMWSMLGGKRIAGNQDWHTKTQPASRRRCNVFTHMGPSGSKPSRRFLTSRSLGVKSGMRWILTMRSPTTCEAQAMNNTKLTPLQCLQQVSLPTSASSQAHRTTCREAALPRKEDEWVQKVKRYKSLTRSCHK